MSYSLDTVDIVFKKLKAMYDDLDPAVKIKDVANNRKELVLENRSRIVCCVCGTKDAARGATLQYVLLTEVAFMDDEKLKNQLVAIEAALRPDGQIVLESTSNGMNYWYELWQKAIHGENQYTPFFFSWLNDKRQFIDEYEQCSEIYFNRHGKYLEVKDLDEEELSLYYKMDGDKNSLVMQKLMWRRMKIANIGLGDFRQEYPTIANESFLESGNNVFDLGKTQERINRLYCVKPLKQSSMELPPLMRKWKKDWVMWRMPKPKERFYAGVDTGEGIGSDNSVIEIIDQDGEQVFEFASNRIKPYEYADLVREVGAFYNMSLLVV